MTIASVAAEDSDSLFYLKRRPSGLGLGTVGADSIRGKLRNGSKSFLDGVAGLAVLAVSAQRRQNGDCHGR
jgi:hypothetical protein